MNSHQDIAVPKPGDIGTIVKYGGKNRQRIEVVLVDVETDMVAGYVLSVKHTGDYRGYVGGRIRDYRPAA